MTLRMTRYGAANYLCAAGDALLLLKSTRLTRCPRKSGEKGAVLAKSRGGFCRMAADAMGRSVAVANCRTGEWLLFDVQNACQSASLKLKPLANQTDYVAHDGERFVIGAGGTIMAAAKGFSSAQTIWGREDCLCRAVSQSRSGALFLMHQKQAKGNAAGIGVLISRGGVREIVFSVPSEQHAGLMDLRAFLMDDGSIVYTARAENGETFFYGVDADGSHIRVLGTIESSATDTVHRWHVTADGLCIVLLEQSVERRTVTVYDAATFKALLTQEMKEAAQVFSESGRREILVAGTPSYLIAY